MSYNQAITRGTGSWPGSPAAGGQNLVPLEQASEIITAVTRGSAALQLFRHIPMSRLQERVPVLSALPSAFFVNGEITPGTYGNGLSQTSSANWEGRYLQAEEIMTNIPISRTLLDDSQYPIWGQVTPLMAEAIGRALDNACFFGVNAPASYPAPILPQSLAAGNSVVAGTSAQAAGSLSADIALLFDKIESEGFEIDGIAAKVAMRVAVRNARMTTGQELTEVSVDEWYGQPVKYPLRGLWPTAVAAFSGTTTSASPTIASVTAGTAPPIGAQVTGAGIPAGSVVTGYNSGATQATATSVVINNNATASATVTLNDNEPLAIIGDFSQGLLGVRQDVSFRVLQEAVLTDASGNIIVNLAQQNAVALQVIARFGFAVANVVTYDQPNESSRWPFGVLLNASSTVAPVE